MSQAQVCRDTHLDRLVVIKALQGGVDRRRLNDEIVALAAIRSKHVVQLYDVIVDRHGSAIGLVEEFLPGDDLNARIPVAEPAEVLKIAYAIACGLADIHQAGHIHRDIKPGNMKFDAEDCLKIFDFGLARQSGDDAATVGAIGTDGYMAPELCVDPDDRVQFSKAIDTYAFAATILKVVRGSIPSAMRRQSPTVPAEADFSNQAIDFAGDVASMLNLCLSAKPKHRPTMPQVRDLLAAHLLKDRHRATLVAGSDAYELNSLRRTVRVSQGRLGSLDLGYDGLRFSVTGSTGDVFVNNIQVDPPHTLPGSCVITVGGPEYGAQRAHITLDVSHPEVVL